MNMKMILALAAVAVATVAGASTNYVECANKCRCLMTVVRDMAKDTALAEPAAYRAALEEFDRSIAGGAVSVGYSSVSRCCPLTARAVLGKCGQFSEKLRGDILATCGYDKENRSILPKPEEAHAVNFWLQEACSSCVLPKGDRTYILNAAIVPVRRAIRAEGGSFVGKDGAKLVKAKLDALAKELNAPRFGKAGEILKKLGFEVEWEFVQSRILADAELDGLKTRLLNGEIPFTSELQNKLCVALGVEGYNAFVREYNGESKK